MKILQDISVHSRRKSASRSAANSKRSLKINQKVSLLTFALSRKGRYLRIVETITA